MAEFASIAFVPSEGKKVSVNDGGSWVELPGVRGWEMSGGGREGRSVSTDSSAPYGTAGVKSVPQIDIEAMAIPYHAGWIHVFDAWDDNDPVRFRLDTEKIEMIPLTTGSVKAAIATTGVVTWAGGDPQIADVPLGAALRIGTTDYFIGSVAVSSGALGAVTVDPAPAAAVASAVYSMRIPGIRFEFNAKVLSQPVTGMSIPHGGEGTGNLMIQPIAPLARPTVLAP